MNIIGIMAATSEGVVGNKGVLPWDYPDELEHFKNTTLDSQIIMGQKTYQSTPKSLFKERQALVLSHDKNFQAADAKIFNSLDQCLKYLKDLKKQNKIFMIGGGQIGNLFLQHNLISHFILSIINKPYPGDVYLNLNLLKEWNQLILKQHKHYTIYSLTNPKEVIWNS